CPGSRRDIRLMPEISRFFGIVIRMFFNDHDPPHFHAAYGEHEALVEIESLAVYSGELPRRALQLVLEWGTLHQEELRYNWERARGGLPLKLVAPLERWLRPPAGR